MVQVVLFLNMVKHQIIFLPFIDLFEDGTFGLLTPVLNLLT